jgi:hypothetical protein
MASDRGVASDPMLHVMMQPPDLQKYCVRSTMATASDDSLQSTPPNTPPLPCQGLPSHLQSTPPYFVLSYLIIFRISIPIGSTSDTSVTISPMVPLQTIDSRCTPVSRRPPASARRPRLRVSRRCLVLALLRLGTVLLHSAHIHACLPPTEL